MCREQVRARSLQGGCLRAGGVHVCVQGSCMKVCASVRTGCARVSACARDARATCVCTDLCVQGLCRAACARGACARSAQGGAMRVQGPCVPPPSGAVTPRFSPAPGVPAGPWHVPRPVQDGWSILGAAWLQEGSGHRRAWPSNGRGCGDPPPNPQPCPRHPGPSRVTVPGASPFPSARAPTHVAIVM